MSYEMQRTPTVLVMHEDPLLSAGVASALQHREFEVLTGAAGELPLDTRAVDVVVADYQSALMLVGETRGGVLPIAARVLALTADDREANIRRAMKAGVHGYLLVGGPIDDLVEAITVLAAGWRYVSKAVAQRIADSFTGAELTPRQSEVLRVLMGGASNKTIARQLNIEVATVKAHLTEIMAKLNASSRTQAASIAATRGLLEDVDGSFSKVPAGRIGAGAQIMLTAGKG
jgi:two-component system NarL family response regulator